MSALDLLLIGSAIAQSASSGAEINSQSQIIVEDRSVTCEQAVSSDNSDNGFVSPALCDLEDWEIKVVGTYPSDALHKNIEGTIRVYGMVSADGEFSDCAINTLGKPWALRSSACKLMKQHAKFASARDQNGQPVTAPISVLIKYVLPKWPDENTSFSRIVEPINVTEWVRQIQRGVPLTRNLDKKNGIVGVRVLVGLNGRVARCEVTRTSDSSALDRSACQGMRRYARFEPALDTNGKPTYGVYATTITYRTE